MDMYVDEVPNRNSPPAILLRESYREGGKGRTRTLANISRWPREQIEALRRVLGGETLVEAVHEVFDAGLGRHLCLGLDCAFPSESGPFRYCIIPPPPFLYMFTHTLPALREMGLAAEEEEAMMLENPRRIVPVRR